METIHPDVLALYEGAMERRNIAFTQSQVSPDLAAGAVALGLLDVQMSRALLEQQAYTRMGRMLKRLDHVVDALLSGALAPASAAAADEGDIAQDAADQVTRVPNAVLDELVGAASVAIASLDHGHPARVRLANALKNPGVGMTLDVEG